LTGLLSRRCAHAGDVSVGLYLLLCQSLLGVTLGEGWVHALLAIGYRQGCLSVLCC
jgi:hypothetical protein